MYEALKQTSLFAYDTETNGQLNRFNVHMVGISFAILTGGMDHAWYLPFNHLDGNQLPFSYLDRLRPVFESTSIEKICHNAKYDEMVLGVHGIDVKGLAHDTFVMAWLLLETTNRKTRKLKPLVKKYLDVTMDTYEDVISAVPKKRGVDRDYNFARVPLNIALSYGGDDSYYTHALYNYFKKGLETEKLWPAYKNVEAPFNRVLGSIEKYGVRIDTDAVDYADQRLPKIVEEVESEVFREAGEVFNIGAPVQLGNILFKKLGIGKNVPKTKTGHFCTDKKTLEKYTKHDIVNNVLRRKKIAKTYSTFVEGTRKAIQKDGRVHPSFNGCGTVTGRLSCSSPNLQNIEGDEVEEIKVRNFFVPADGYKFIVADYGQIEYRLMAHFSGDKYMVDAFHSGRDFHEETARYAFKVPDDRTVTHRERFIAKSINFGVGYGRGPTSLAETLGCSFEEAQDFIANYYKTFKGLAAYKKHVISQARKRGYVRTLTGRKRRLLPEIRSDSWKIKGKAERQAFNTRIQGSAADIIKMAMVSLDPALKEHQAQMVIQIHDELVIEVPENNAEEALLTTKDIMEHPLNGKNPLRLPIITEPTIVDRWGEAK